jgi:metal-sulfur cluster biosynthetic enzyme
VNAADDQEARKHEAERVVNEIIDPCSAARALPLGLVDMGIAHVTVQGKQARISLLPTFPGCLFLPLFEEEIRSRVLALAWCAEVAIEPMASDTIWDESHMTERARTRLAAQRAQRRRQLLPVIAPSSRGKP